jgi:hypothetical protein
MRRIPLRQALALGATLSVVTVGGAYAASQTGLDHSADHASEHRTPPAEEVPAPAVPTSTPTPQGPAVLPDQASDRATQAIAERGRATHAQGPKTAGPTTEATEEPTDDASAGPGYGPGVHAGPHGDYGPDIHPDATNHPGNVERPGPGAHDPG